MKDIQNDKALLAIALLALVMGITTCILRLWTIGGLLLAMSLIIGILLLQIRRRRKHKKTRYHAVHWNDGHITKDE
ncbi:MAG: hypothetical protein KBT12_07335 [Bacteroidales bacterium]|nr:hypothetical protein [Candidatus Physcousia equi]